MFSAPFLAALKAAPYALFEQHGDLPAAPQTHATLEAAASAVAKLVDGQDYTCVGGAFVWGETAQDKPALLLTVSPRGGDAPRRFTLTTQGETPAQLASVMRRRAPKERLL